MRRPFPGMDPWLESPTLWADVHGRLITSIADELAPQLAPRYFVGVEDARVNFVEIDLLRAGEPMPVMPAPPPSDYRILVCRACRRRDAVMTTFPYTSPIPPIAIPLLPGDPEPELDLNSVLHALIERAHYDLVIDYFQPPDPPLRPVDEAWAASIVVQAIADRREVASNEKGTR